MYTVRVAVVVLRVGFDRPNLYFEVIEKPLKIEEAFQQLLRYILSTFPQATGIVYCMTKNECEETAEVLRSHGVSVFRCSSPVS